MANILAAAVGSTGDLAVAAEPPRSVRFVGRRAGGDLLQGDTLTDWHATASEPKLDGAPLLAGDPLLWLRDQRIGPAASRPEAYVELFGGDLLPGRVSGWSTGSDSAWEPAPPLVLVEPSERLWPPAPPAAPHIRVVRSFVRKIVWQHGDTVHRRFQPLTAFYR
ncbi:MAG: hypothetical protein JJ992_12750, partial [Planctomycetes bacterium]|nr:hypothetical protein [Planctomycetota bacterium]